MAGEVWEYIAVVWPLWAAVAGSGVLFGADELIARYSRRGKECLERLLPEARRRRLEYTFLLVALFVAGFGAWREEHHKYLEASGGGTPRILTAHARQVIRDNLDTLRSWKHSLSIYTASGGDSLDYAWQFYELFKDMEIPRLDPQAVPCRLEERDVLIGVKHLDNPSPQAKEWYSILKEARIPVSYTRWYMPDFPDELDFDLLICPSRT